MPNFLCKKLFWPSYKVERCGFIRKTLVDVQFDFKILVIFCHTCFEQCQISLEIIKPALIHPLISVQVRYTSISNVGYISAEVRHVSASTWNSPEVLLKKGFNCRLCRIATYFVYLPPMRLCMRNQWPLKGLRSITIDFPQGITVWEGSMRAL